MFSRAHLLIEREFDKLIKEDLPGIEAFPITEDNIFEWAAKVRGLRNTLWEEGIFRVYIKFDEHYNSRPPQVCFHTIPFHPNVDMITGQPCIDFLDDFSHWKDSYTIQTILLAVQTMLSNPVLENAVNIEAVDMILNSPHSYRQMVLDCVAASQRVDAGLSPHLSESRVHFGPTPEPQPQYIDLPPNRSAEKSARVSFDEYHSTWSGIATSKPREDMMNPIMESLKEKPHLQNIHYGLSYEELQLQTQRQMDEHNMLMYGRFKDKPRAEDSKSARLAKVERMRKIYLPQRTPTPGTGHVRFHDPQDDIVLNNMEAENNEIDNLVAWTTKLDENNI